MKGCGQLACICGQLARGRGVQPPWAFPPSKRRRGPQATWIWGAAPCPACHRGSCDMRFFRMHAREKRRCASHSLQDSEQGGVHAAKSVCGSMEPISRMGPYPCHNFTDGFTKTSPDFTKTSRDFTKNSQVRNGFTKTSQDFTDFTSTSSSLHRR